MTDVRWSDPAYEAVARLVGVRTGLSFGSGLQARAEAGIARAMARTGLADLARYGELILARADALDDLLVELTVGETYFFREPAQFAFIRNTVLPEIRRQRGPEHMIRAWSAGCASGEEAYSLAIVLAEQEGLGAAAQVRATDISRAALAKARAATYGAWSLRGEGATSARPHLGRAGERWVVHEKIRARVRFEPLNLALDIYPSCATGIWGMDLILCRNVLIYFDPHTVLRVARRLYESLAPGGWLITAPSDPSLFAAAPFDTVATDVGVFYRRAAAADVALLPRPFADLPPAAAPDAVAFVASAAEAPPSVRALIDAAELALARGDYQDAVRLTQDHQSDVAAALLHVRAFANLDGAEAARACAAALECHPLSPELHYLGALLLFDLGRDAEAVKSVRRVLYLDRSLAAAHLTLGTILRRLGERDAARRAYRNARDLCRGCPPDEVVPLTDGEHAGRLAETAEVELALLDATEVDA